MGHRVPKKPNCLFAFSSTLVVFRFDQPPWLICIANDHGNAGGRQRYALELQRPRIYKQCMVLLSESGNKLVHNTALNANKLALRTQTYLRSFNSLEIEAARRLKCKA